MIDFKAGDVCRYSFGEKNKSDCTVEIVRILDNTWNLFPAGKGFFFDKRRWRREIWLRCSPTLAGRNYKTASRTLQIPSGKLQSTNPLRRNGYSHLITKLQNYIANAQVYNEHLALPPSPYAL